MNFKALVEKYFKEITKVLQFEKFYFLAKSIGTNAETAMGDMSPFIITGTSLGFAI